MADYIDGMHLVYFSNTATIEAVTEAKHIKMAISINFLNDFVINFHNVKVTTSVIHEAIITVKTNKDTIARLKT